MEIWTRRCGKHWQHGVKLGLVGESLWQTEAASSETLNFPVFAADSAVTFPPAEWHVWGRTSAAALRHSPAAQHNFFLPAQSPAARAHAHQSPPAQPGLSRKSDENSVNQPGPQHDDRNESRHPTASQLIPPQRRVRSGSASLQETVIGGRRSASDGEGASKPGHASGTRRHLMGSTNMFVELVSKSAIFTMTQRSRGTYVFIYWKILILFSANSYFWKISQSCIYLDATTELTIWLFWGFKILYCCLGGDILENIVGIMSDPWKGFCLFIVILFNVWVLAPLDGAIGSIGCFSCFLTFFIRLK